MRAAFKWSAVADLIDREPRYGPGFKKPPKSVVQRAKGERQAIYGTLDFTAEELIAILAKSSSWLKACILLGINAGFGAADCGRLRSQNIDF